MKLKKAMEDAWAAQGVNSPVLKARWKRRFKAEQGELRLEAKSQSSLPPITIARAVGRSRPR